MTRSFAWLYLQTRIPADWEMVLYSLDETFGSLELATREGIQARLHWRRLRGKSSAPPWDWHWDNDKDGLRAQCVLPEEKVRLTWTFPAAGLQTAEAVVQACEAQAPGRTRISVQGIEAVIPPGYTPREVQILPANVMLALEGPGGSRVVHRRWGLPDLVLQGREPEDFFRRMLLSLRMRVGDLSPCTLLGREAVCAEFSCRGLSPLSRLLFQRARGRGWIWLDPDTLRLQTLEFLGARRVPYPNPEDCLYAG
jgi:hypothetical protein